MPEGIFLRRRTARRVRAKFQGATSRSASANALSAVAIAVPRCFRFFSRSASSFRWGRTRVSFAPSRTLVQRLCRRSSELAVLSTWIEARAFFDAIDVGQPRQLGVFAEGLVQSHRTFETRGMRVEATPGLNFGYPGGLRWAPFSFPRPLKMALRERRPRPASKIGLS